MFREHDEFEQYRARSYSGGFSPTHRICQKPRPQNLLIPNAAPLPSALSLSSSSSSGVVGPADEIYTAAGVRSSRRDSVETQLLEVVFERRAPEQTWSIGEMRPRVGSVPSKRLNAVSSSSQQLLPPDPLPYSDATYPLRKVRSFTIMGNRLVREGDLYVSGRPLAPGQSDDFRSRESSGSATTGSSRLGEVSGGDVTPCQERYKIMMAGLKGVGKSTIVAQFLLRTNLDSDDFDGLSDEDDLVRRQNCASIILDGEEATLEIIDFSDNETDDLFVSSDHQVAAYVVVYSVEDRKSFEAAIDRLYELREEDLSRQMTVILVANKVDLVRTRVVQTQEGKNIAKQYECKFIEISAAIGHQIDELFIGVLKQIRLISQRQQQQQHHQSGRGSCVESSIASSRHGLMDMVQSPDEQPRTQCASLHDSACCLVRARDNVLGRLLRGERRASRSCVNLYVL